MKKLLFILLLLIAPAVHAFKVYTPGSGTGSGSASLPLPAGATNYIQNFFPAGGPQANSVMHLSSSATIRHQLYVRSLLSAGAFETTSYFLLQPVGNNFSTLASLLAHYTEDDQNYLEISHNTMDASTNTMIQLFNMNQGQILRIRWEGPGVGSGYSLIATTHSILIPVNLIVSSSITANGGLVVLSTQTTYAPDSNSKIVTGVTDLPSGGGFGPQVAYPYIFARSHVSGTDVSSFRLLSSTQANFATGRYGDIEWSANPGNNPFFGWIINGDGASIPTTAMNLERGTFTVSASLSILNGFIHTAIGTSTFYGQGASVFAVKHSSASNLANTQTELFGSTIPGGGFFKDGDSFEIKAHGVFGAGASANKRIVIAFGIAGTSITFDTGALTASSEEWKIEGRITRVGANAQKCFFSGSRAATNFTNDFTALTQNSLGDNLFRISGQGTQAADVTLNYAIIEYVPGRSQ